MISILFATSYHIFSMTKWWKKALLSFWLIEAIIEYNIWLRGKLWSRLSCIYVYMNGFVKNKVSGGRNKGSFKHLHLSRVKHSCWVILEFGIHNKLYNALHFLKHIFFFIGNCLVSQISGSRRLEKRKKNVSSDTASQVSPEICHCDRQEALEPAKYRITRLFSLSYRFQKHRSLFLLEEADLHAKHTYGRVKNKNKRVAV